LQKINKSHLKGAKLLNLLNFNCQIIFKNVISDQKLFSISIKEVKGIHLRLKQQELKLLFNVEMIGSSATFFNRCFQASKTECDASLALFIWANFSFGFNL